MKKDGDEGNGDDGDDNGDDDGDGGARTTWCITPPQTAAGTRISTRKTFHPPT